MDEVTAYIPYRMQGFVVANLTVHVRANYDEAFPDTFNLAAEVAFEDERYKRHSANSENVKAILAQIRDECPDAWRELNERAMGSYLEGCPEVPEPVYFEDNVTTMSR